MDGEDERLGKIGTQRLHAVHLCTHVNAYAERFVHSIKESCLRRLILFGEDSLRMAVREFLAHYLRERHHQGLGNRLIVPETSEPEDKGAIQCRERLGGMLKYYHRAA
jgi:putative transposase